jgi:Plant protein of unknown function
MDPDAPEAEEEISNSISSARTHKAPKPQTDREKWIISIKNRADEGFRDVTKSYLPVSTAGSSSKEKPSVYWTREHPNFFYIGYLLRQGVSHDPRMWAYVAFMTRWFGLDIDFYLEYIKEKEDLVRSYYDEVYINKDSKSFLESLLVASCFLGFVIHSFQKIRNGTENLKGSSDKYNSDLVDERSLQFSKLYRIIMKDQMLTKIDMLRLENQIPWFVVEAVYKNFNFSEVFGTSIETLAMSCFDDLYPKANKSKVQGGSFPKGGFKHLLHIFHWTRTPKDKWLIMDTKSEQVRPSKKFVEFYIPNATNLLESATSVERLDGGSIDVTYSNNWLWALMKITSLHIFPYSRDIFKILLNFEQRYLECGLPVTAYLACMKSLLQTKADVKLLQKNGILQNTLKGEQDILNFVHDMATYLVENLNSCIPDDLHSLSEKVTEHHEGNVSRVYSEFMSQFCPNRWVIISVIGAIILFVFTFMQTIYTALGYYKGT